MSDESYFVKIRGRVMGPFAPQRLVQMVNQGQLSRIHMLSTDGDVWQRASEFPEFFEVPVNPKTASPEAVAPVSSTPATNDQPPPQDQWHYEADSQSVGPVPQSTIIGLIKSGQLQRGCLVWNPGLEDWITIENVPEFARFNQPTQQTAQTPNADGDPESSLLETAHIIRGQTNWVYFICIFLYVTAAALFFMFILGLVQGSQQRDGIRITQGIFSLVQMVIVVFAALFLNRYASAASRFVVLKDARELNLALTWLGRFWLVVGIVLIVWMVLVLILIVYIFVLGGAFLP